MRAIPLSLKMQSITALFAGVPLNDRKATRHFFIFRLICLSRLKSWMSQITLTTKKITSNPNPTI